MENNHFFNYIIIDILLKILIFNNYIPEDILLKEWKQVLRLYFHHQQFEQLYS